MMMVKRVVTWTAVFLAVLGLAPPSAATSSRSEVVKAAVRATVFIRADRRYHSRELETFGSGFFIDAKGHILTNNHVVANKIEAQFWDGHHQIDLSVVRLTVVVDPGTSVERELTAVVVAQDPLRDLALLKVNFEPAYWIGLNRGAVPEVTDEVLAVGFPFGDLLTMDDQGRAARGGNPEASVSMGRVTSVRRDAEREVAAIQVDAAVNPGNSGGPLLGADGELLGMVYAQFAAGEQLGFAIPAQALEDFFAAQTVRVRFKPPFVMDEGIPIEVEVSSGVTSVDAVRGTVSLQGKGIGRVETDLVGNGQGWQAVLDVPRVYASDGTVDDSFVATVRLFGRSRRPVFERRYRLKRKTTADPLLATARDPGQVMGDRKRYANRLSLSDHADRMAAGSDAVDGETGTQTRDLGSETGNSAGEMNAEESQQMAQLLADRGRDLLRDGDVEAAIHFLSEAVRLDPGNELAAGFLDLARQQRRLAAAEQPQQAAGATSEPAATAEAPHSAAAVDEEPAGTATIHIHFDCPIKKGLVRVLVDGVETMEHPFKFKNFKKALLGGKTGSGRISEDVPIPSGRRQLGVVLAEEKGDVIGEHSFTEYFDDGSRWTLRIEMPSDDAEPGFFLVRQRR